jgi:hypothetical protein
MSRVIPDTILRRAAAASLIALTASFAACGAGNAPESAAVASTPAATSTPVAAATTPAAAVTTTPAHQKTEESSEKSGEKSSNSSSSDKPPAASDSQPSDASGAAPAAPPPVVKSKNVKKKHDAAQVKDPISQKQLAVVAAALHRAGYDPIVSPKHGDVLSSMQVGSVSLVFYKTAKQAASSAAQFQAVIDQNPKAAKLELAGSRVYFLGTTKNMSAKEQREFDKLSDLSERTLAAQD